MTQKNSSPTSRSVTSRQQSRRQPTAAPSNSQPGGASRSLQGYDYRRRADSDVETQRPAKLFTVGRVFKVIWPEPARDSRIEISSRDSLRPLAVTRDAQSSNPVYTRVRRFVVIREGANYCSALPITTYAGRGVAKPDVQKSEHSIIYTGRRPPNLTQDEMPRLGEHRMLLQPIRIVQNDPGDRLGPMSRLDYGKVHTMYHKVKVRAFGQVHPESMQASMMQFALVWVHDALRSPLERILRVGSRIGARSDDGIDNANDEALEHRGDEEGENEFYEEDDERLESANTASAKGDLSHSEATGDEDDGGSTAMGERVDVDLPTDRFDSTHSVQFSKGLSSQVSSFGQDTSERETQ